MRYFNSTLIINLSILIQRFKIYEPLAMVLFKELLLPCFYFLLLFHLLPEADLHLMSELTFKNVKIFPLYPPISYIALSHLSWSVSVISFHILQDNSKRLTLS